MTVLVSGMRDLNANFGKSRHGVLTDRPETPFKDFVTAWNKVMNLDRFDLA